MDRERCLDIIEAYGVGPNAIQLIRLFWEIAVLVCRSEGNYGLPFHAGRGVTQGGPLSPKLFNFMVDTVVQEWLRRLFGRQPAAHGLDARQADGATLYRLFLALFYADDGYIASRNPVLLDRALGILSGLFKRVGLATNTDKTKTVICVPGKIWTRLSSSAYFRRFGGFQTAAGWAARRVECDVCGANLAASSLPGHLETQHGVHQALVLEEEYLRAYGPGGAGSGQDYSTYRSATDRKFRCPVPGCLGEAARAWGIRRHFRDRHPADWVVTPGEGRLPKCMRCGMQTAHSALAGSHERTNLCRTGRAQRGRQI